jgi:CRP-like cAMP-binding protein
MAPRQNEDRLRLSEHPMARDLDGAARDALLDLFDVADVAAGRSVLEEGQVNTRLFIVLDGRVSVKLPKRARRVSEVKLATLGTGEVFGEYSVFDGQPVSATVFAVEDTRVAWVEKTALDRYVDAHREAGRTIYEWLLRTLVGRLRANDAELDVITIG